jgi:hypothetical protein
MKNKLKAALAAVAVSGVLAACGGDSSGDNVVDNSGNNGGNNGGVSGEINPGISIQSVYDYIAKLIADKDENSTPVDVNALTLAVDETSPPVAFTP